MRRITRLSLLALLLVISLLALPNRSLEAQAGGGEQAEAPEAFVPSEKLPVDSAVSFHVDI